MIERAALQAYVRVVDAGTEESGLAMLGYALGAAAVLVPLAIAILAFGTDTISEADQRVNAAVGGP